MADQPNVEDPNAVPQAVQPPLVQITSMESSESADVVLKIEDSIMKVDLIDPLMKADPMEVEDVQEEDELDFDPSGSQPLYTPDTKILKVRTRDCCITMQLFCVEKVQDTDTLNLNLSLCFGCARSLRTQRRMETILTKEK